LDIPELLNAAHIIPWRTDEKHRADPRNGICLNVFHDRAFDRGLISFDDKLRVIVSSTVSRSTECPFHRELLLGLSGCPLRLPQRFQPEPAALEYHRKHIYLP
jgi:putative restriction endonuclease